MERNRREREAEIVVNGGDWNGGRREGDGDWNGGRREGDAGKVRAGERLE